MARPCSPDRAALCGELGGGFSDAVLQADVQGTARRCLSQPHGIFSQTLSTEKTTTCAEEENLDLCRTYKERPPVTLFWFPFACQPDITGEHLGDVAEERANGEQLWGQ